MATPTDITIALLQSIDASLKALVAQSRAGAAQMRVLPAPQGLAPSPAPAHAIAADTDLDGQYGDPIVKFMPRDWTGEDHRGRKMSEMPAALLDMLAETYDYFAQKAEESGEVTKNNKPVAPYKRKDAARARGWAKRVRAGHRRAVIDEATPLAPAWPAAEWEGPPDDDGEIPF